MKKITPSIILRPAEDDTPDAAFIPVVSEGLSDMKAEIDTEKPLALLNLRNVVLFPGVVFPVAVARKKSLRLIHDTYNKDGIIGAVAQKDKNVENPKADDIFKVGTLAKIVKILEMPDNSTTVILQGKQRFSIKEIVAESPYMKAYVDVWQEEDAEKLNKNKSKDFTALIEALKDSAQRVARMSSPMSQEFAFAIRNIESAGYFVNFVSANLNLPLQDKQALLETHDLEQRSQLLLQVLTKESQMLEIKASIQNKAMENIDKQQREYFLQQQMKTIQNELGGNIQEQDVNEIRKAAEKKKWDDKIKEAVYKEIDKLEAMTSHSPDYQVQINYVHTLVGIPWNEYTKDNFNLARAQRILDKNHFGLDDVKERIIEHLAVLKLKGDMKSPIICLYGPPGVGKTSLGKSVADALNRKYARVSLGGLHDEAEIRGHRRTYIGAMPGRIIQNIIKAQSANPVFILDEIDKVGNDYKGDPSSALLEVLDPEQNSTFHDNYVDLDFDLSKVLFIATANSLSGISQPLLDRMELINISGYIQEEKVEIARKHLIPKEWENHGIDKKTCGISKKGIEKIIDSYTRESGVRALDKQIAKIARKLAKKLAMNEEIPLNITEKEIESYLGTPVYTSDKQEEEELTGVVTGLAWTSVGGEILQIETSISKHKGEKLTLTGNLGDVMKESATLGLAYIKEHAADFGIDDDLFENTAIHIHVPEGAIPKDGPSAGITMATSLLSALTGRKVKKHIAMTGEITLKGKVLPVGGIKEKILAAKRAGVTDIIICKDNLKDINDIKEIYIKGLTFHYVSNVKEVFDLALA